MIRRCAAVFTAIVFIAVVLMAQQVWEKKPFGEWTKEEVTTVLEKSPWASVFNKALESVGHIRSTGEAVTGAEMKYDKLSFRFGLLSAKPVRMALARRSMLSDAAGAAKTDWGKYVEQENEKEIVVIMYFSANPAGSNTELAITDTIDQLKTSDLSNQTFLVTDGGKKVALTQFDTLGENGYGYKFVFPRNLPDGSPLIGANNKELRFETVFSFPKEKRMEGMPPTLPVTGKWDLKKMVFQGKLVF
jgi:hypothetical protein